MKATPLSVRKQLLIAESEVNRTLFVRECHALAGGAREMAMPIKQVVAIAASMSAAAGLFKAVQAARRPSTTAGKPPSLAGSLIRLALWFAVRGMGRAL